jgi:flavin-binding protein dodecin
MEHAENLKCTRTLIIHAEVDCLVVKIIELIGSSKEGWKEATQNAVDEAARTVRNIKSVHVKRITAKVEKNKIVEYRAVVRIAFTVDRGK